MAGFDSISVPAKDAQTKTETEKSPVWLVIVRNDPVNLMSYVVMVFRRVFGFDRSTAQKHMLEVHELGRSVLWTGDREKAEAYVHELQGWQLDAFLQQDADD